MRPFRLTYAFVASLFLFATLAAPGYQQNTMPPVTIPRQPNSGESRIGDTDPAIRTIEVKQQHARNEERQKRLVADTDKLLALATQLHDDVGKTDKNILSLDVVKRAEEIEKLAHSVRERMKG